MLCLLKFYKLVCCAFKQRKVKPKTLKGKCKVFQN